MKCDSVAGPSLWNPLVLSFVKQGWLFVAALLPQRVHPTVHSLGRLPSHTGSNFFARCWGTASSHFSLGSLGFVWRWAWRLNASSPCGTKDHSLNFFFLERSTLLLLLSLGLPQGNLIASFRSFYWFTGKAVDSELCQDGGSSPSLGSYWTSAASTLSSFFWELPSWVW